MQVAVVGGGAGGVELSLALNQRLRQERRMIGKEAAACCITLLTSGHILPGHTSCRQTQAPQDC